MDEINNDLKFGLNWSHTSEAELKALIDTSAACKVIQKLYEDFKAKSFQDMAVAKVNPSALDVSEKIEAAKYATASKLFYTLSHIDQLARIELDRRFKKQLKETKEKAQKASL